MLISIGVAVIFTIGCFTLLSTAFSESLAVLTYVNSTIDYDKFRESNCTINSTYAIRESGESSQFIGYARFSLDLTHQTYFTNVRVARGSFVEVQNNLDNNYKPGTRVVCYYDLSDPTAIYFQPPNPVSSLLLSIVITVTICIVCGVIVILGVILSILYIAGQ